ncbi:hypothetical protein FOMPIDRAFT_160517 [Fomitopsis schrenkii]|uniref:RlpA-like protein double-psi beta-barrel domain-containing protein n=1 Tax=Fomitopsis schrenkii TaxID=2126942 RepID=S8EI78_FOMSC|nr:hypothetical protein FOMPIDRAFT_160517 [Fomitopsis schrenkii]
MMFAKTAIALALALSATALTVPHHGANSGHRRALAHRAQLVEPELLKVPEVVPRPKRKRSLGRRCAPANSTATASIDPSATSGVGNLGSSVPIDTSSIFVTPTTSWVAPTESSSSWVDTTSWVAPTTSEAPPPTTTEAPAPTTTEAPAPTTTEAPAPTTTAASSGSGPSWLYGTQSGDGTFYDAGLGACGITNTDSDYIIAVSWDLFDNYPGYDGENPNTNPVCGKKITATYEDKSVEVTVTDRCTGCDATSLDFTPTAFQNLASLATGRIYGMTWMWSS